METLREMKMNTSLKNARIFDDDAWEEKDGMQVKKEIKSESDTDFNKMNEQDYLITLNKIEKGLQDNNKIDIKVEPQDDNIFDDTLEDGEVRSFICDKMENEHEYACKTPPYPSSTKIKPDPDEKIDARFDESPYNKELFNNLKIKEETPIKTEYEESSNSTGNSLKSAKRTVFSRQSPYKRFDNDDVFEKRISAKSRLGPKMNDEELPRKQSRLKQDIETDPAVITRREKQIEYGKNTVGYDNYIKLVPRQKRELDDPQTPDKYKKYSRRGWDGLIKQWRLKLHKYDPATDT